MDKSSWAIAGTVLAITISAVSAGYYLGSERGRLTTLSDTVDSISRNVEKNRNELDQQKSLEEIITAENVTGGVQQIVKGEIGEFVTFANGGKWGSWSVAKFCPAEKPVVCGLQQKVEANQQAGDDSAMNALGFYCCSLSQLQVSSSDPR